jgi:hypothetical protein
MAERVMRLLVRGPVGALLLGVTLAAAPAGAQTIRPITAEYTQRADGKVELVNNADTAVWVTLQAYGFVPDDRGRIRETPLPSGIHVRLSAMSVQIPARQSRYVFYQVTADSPPAWVVLYASFWSAVTRGTTGVATQVELPHFIYVLPESRLKADDVDVRLVATDRERQRLTLAITNRGRQFGRVTAIETPDQRGRSALAGFALFPRSQRLVDVAWNGRESVDVIIRTARFRVSRQLVVPGG